MARGEMEQQHLAACELHAHFNTSPEERDGGGRHGMGVRREVPLATAKGALQRVTTLKRVTTALCSPFITGEGLGFLGKSESQDEGPFNFQLFFRSEFFLFSVPFLGVDI